MVWCNYCKNGDRAKCDIGCRPSGVSLSSPTMFIPKDEYNPEPTSERSKILRTAEKVVCGHRESDYGSPENNFGLIARFWQTYLGIGVSAKDVAMLMALLKIARIRSGSATEDSFIDLAGYAACGGEIVKKVKAVDD